MFCFKPPLLIIITSIWIVWQKQALETVCIGSFVAANVLRLLRSSIERNGTRFREHSVGVLQDVQSAKTLEKIGAVLLPLVVGRILSASTIFHDCLRLQEKRILVQCVPVFLTFPQCV